MDFLQLKSPKDFLEAARSFARTQPMSIRQLSGKLGYSSDRTIGMVLKGQRQMSSEMQARVVKHLKLTPKEQLHLQALVRRERSGEEVAMASSSLAARPSHVFSVSADRLHPLIPAYSLVILEMLRIAKRPLSIDEIRSRLREKVELEDLDHCLQGLKDAGFLKSDEAGIFRALGENEYLTTSVDVPSTAIREIHRRQLARAIDVLEEQSTADREYVAKTLSVARERLPEIKRLIRQKVEELAEEITEGDNVDDLAIVQLNLQFYLQT